MENFIFCAVSVKQSALKNVTKDPRKHLYSNLFLSKVADWSSLIWWYHLLLLILLFHGILKMISRINFKCGSISFHRQETTDKISAPGHSPFTQIYLSKLCSQYLPTFSKNQIYQNINFTKGCTHVSFTAKKSYLCGGSLVEPFNDMLNKVIFFFRNLAPNKLSELRLDTLSG